MKIKNKNYKAELAAYKEKVEKMNLVYVEKEIKYCYGNDFKTNDIQYIRRCLSKRLSGYDHRWSIPRNEKNEVINPYRAYIWSIKDFLAYNIPWMVLVLFTIITLIFVIIIANYFNIEVSYDPDFYVPIYFFALFFIDLFGCALFLTSLELHRGIKKYKKQWDEILAKNGIYKPNKYITK